MGMFTAPGDSSVPSDGAVERASREAAASAHGWIVELVREDGPGILRLLWRLLGREADVMDAYQDCFCKLAQVAKPGDLRNARAYAYRTASNVAIEMLRVRKRRADHWPAVVRTKHPPPHDQPADTHERVVSVALREAIARLPDHLRNVIVLRDLGRLPYA